MSLIAVIHNVKEVLYTAFFPYQGLNVKHIVWLWALLPLVMVGCGQSGPLYLPGSTQPLPPSPSSVI